VKEKGRRERGRERDRGVDELDINIVH